MTRDEGKKRGEALSALSVWHREGGRPEDLFMLAGSRVLFRYEADFAARNAEIRQIAIRQLREFADCVALASPAANVLFEGRNRKH